MTWEIRQGDALESLREMPDESVQCCVTSPPYWGLRDYGVDGQVGLEATPAEYLDRLVEIFAEVRRVLRSDGTCWLNIGDSYAGSWKGQGQKVGLNPLAQRQIDAVGRKERTHTGSIPAGVDYKAKDLMMVPAQLALALRRDGWWLRSEVIWEKPNTRPENVKDRPTMVHEHLFQLTRSRRYYYDHEAVRERSAVNGVPGNVNNVGIHARAPRDGKRNLRSVWRISTVPGSGHFAMFPPKLVEPCIRASSSDHASGGGRSVILDPFAGAATVGLVATRLDRDFIGIELNPEYVELGRNRILDDAPLLNTGTEAAA